MDLVYLIVCFFDVVLFGAEDTIEPRYPSCIDFFPPHTWQFCERDLFGVVKP